MTPVDPAPTSRTARVRLPTTFAVSIGGLRHLDVTAHTVGAALRAVSDRHPGLRPLFWINAHTLNPVIMIFHNETLIRDDTLDSALADGDIIDVVPAVESG